MTAEEEFESARVKWFNRKQGYGIVTRGADTPDIFVHMNTVREGNLRNLDEGQQVLVKTRTSIKGERVTEIKLP